MYIMVAEKEEVIAEILLKIGKIKKGDIEKFAKDSQKEFIKFVREQEIRKLKALESARNMYVGCKLKTQ